MKLFFTLCSVLFHALLFSQTSSLLNCGNLSFAQREDFFNSQEELPAPTRSQISGDGQSLVMLNQGSNQTGVNDHISVYRWNGFYWDQQGTSIDVGNMAVGQELKISFDGSTIGYCNSSISDAYVRVYNWNGESWEQVGFDITPSASPIYDWDLSGDGSSLAISSRVQSTNGSYTVVRVFQYNGIFWVQKGQDLLEETFLNQNNSQFGQHLDLSSDGSTIAVAAYWADVNAQNAGALTVFRFQNNSWELLGDIFYGEEEETRLGAGIALSGDGNVVAFNSEINGFSRLSVFSFANGSWSEMGGLIPDNDTGIPVISDDGLVLGVSDIFANIDEIQQGYSKIYSFDGMEWVLSAYIEGEPISSYNEGRSLSISANGYVFASGHEVDDVFGIKVFEFFCISGCTDQEACNYNVLALEEDGSCLYPDENYLDCQGFCLNDIDQNGICDELEVAGCTDPTACNYDDTAIEDDGSCTYPTESFLDCEGNCLNDMDLNGVCDELEILGCTDPTACNYEELATQDDGTCDYIDAILIVGDTTPFTLEESVYNCTNTPGSTYEWVVEGGVLSSGQGTSVVTVLWAEIGNGLLTVTESTESQCQGTTTLQVQIECSTSTTAIDGPVGPGELLELVYSCDGDAGSTFDWSISNGVITSGQGSSTVTVIWASTGLGSISVQETTAANCDGDEITLDVVVVVSTGINDITTERLVSVYPNPASSSVNISVGEHLLGSSFSLYDCTGRIVKAGTINSRLTELATSDILSGNYTLVLLSNDEIVRQSVIVK